MVTAAATAEENILLEGKGLMVDESFLCSLSRVSRRAPLDWLSFSHNLSLSCFNRRFSSNIAVIAEEFCGVTPAESKTRLKRAQNEVIFQTSESNIL